METTGEDKMNEYESVVRESMRQTEDAQQMCRQTMEMIDELLGRVRVLMEENKTLKEKLEKYE